MFSEIAFPSTVFAVMHMLETEILEFLGVAGAFFYESIIQCFLICNLANWARMPEATRESSAAHVKIDPENAEVYDHTCRDEGDYFPEVWGFPDQPPDHVCSIWARGVTMHSSGNKFLQST